MTATASRLASVPLRPPDRVMKLERLGAFHQTRLSFMRALLRRLKRENWRFDRPVWRVDETGVGHAVYRARGPERTYSLVCFAHDLPDELRSDRVIAEAWDATFTLFDGVPDEADIERLSRNVPRQEAGRVSCRELSVSRANRSVRLFEHVVDRLSRGEQPDRDKIEATGYLMRTTAVYGNGKLGAADRDRIAERPELAGPFRAEMLSVWLTRAFTVDIAEHLARARAPETAVPLDRDLRRRLGVGNATGLGMAPFLVNHPTLLHAWIAARETALARVRALPRATPKAADLFVETLARSRSLVDDWRTDDARQTERIARLAVDLERLHDRVGDGALRQSSPWDALYRWAAETLSLEGQELVVSLLLEPQGDLVDDLAEAMAVDEDECFRIHGAMPVGELRSLIERNYAWALDVDFSDPGEAARFWYTSEVKLEPRLGERAVIEGADLELPLAVGRDVSRLYDTLAGSDGSATLAGFLLHHPEHRHAARRVQIAARFPYAEIRDNLIGRTVMPIDLLRCKLSFFGATKFDPRSDRWVRICMYQGAPFPDEFDDQPADNWAYPPLR